MPIRIIIADDHRMMRDALITVLNEAPDMDVVGTAENGRDAVALARELEPDVVVMDIGMPDLNGVDATARIHLRNPEIKIIALSTYADKRFINEMSDAGATGYVAKASAATELMTAIRAVVKGRRYLCPRALAEVGDTETAASRPEAALSRREREVLQLVAEGLRTTEIAERMHVAESTVDVHRRNIMRKLHLHNVADLTKYAIREGITLL
jgi:two-component system NarL family response regulator